MGQIADWLKQLGLGQYAQRFADNDVNFGILSDLTDQDLKEIGVSCREEVVGATWREFDMAAKRWFIPASRMKNRKDHFVPLTDAAIACLGEPGQPDA